MTTKRKILLFSGIGVLLLFTAIWAFATFATYSDGYRAGSIIKFSHKGVLFKTYEGELNQYVGTIGTPQVWAFSVEGNKEVVAAIEDAMARGYRVKVHYKERFWKLFWKGETRYFVTGVEKVEN